MIYAKKDSLDTDSKNNSDPCTPEIGQDQSSENDLLNQRRKNQCCKYHIMEYSLSPELSTMDS